MLLTARAVQGCRRSLRHRRDCAHGNRLSGRRSAGACVRRHRVISGVAMALGPTLRLPGRVARLALDLFANIPFWRWPGRALLVAETNDQEGRQLDPVGIALLTISLGLTIDALLRRDGSWPRGHVPRRWRNGGVPVRWQQWRSPRPVLDPRVFATSAMAGPPCC